MGACLIWNVALLSLAVGPGPTTESAEPTPSATLFLYPETRGVAAGKELPVRLQRGDVGIAGAPQDVPWAATPTRWLFVRTAGTQLNLESPTSLLPAVAPAEEEPQPSVLLPIERPGVVMIGVEAQPWVETVAAGDWHAFAAEALDPAAADAIAVALPPDAPVRIRRIESAKAVVRIGADGEVVDAQTASSKAGQASEIRLLQDATALAIGSDFQVRAYTDFASRGGVRVRGACDACEQVQRITVDRYGIGFLQLTDPGTWRIEAHFARRLPDGEDADVVVYSASLVFEAADAAPKERE